MSYFKSSRQLNNIKGHDVKRKVKGIGLACGIALSGMVFFSSQEAHADEVTYTDGDITADLTSNVETPEESYGLTSEEVTTPEVISEENVGSTDVMVEEAGSKVIDGSSLVGEVTSNTSETPPNGVSSIEDINLSSIFSEEDELTKEESYTVLRNVTSTSNNDNIVVNIVTDDNELVNGASSITSTINLNINEELKDVTLVHYYLAGQNDEPFFGELKTTDLVLGTITKQNNDDFNRTSFVNPGGTKKSAEKSVITFDTIPQGSYISINSTLTSGGRDYNDLYRYITDLKELETGIPYKSVVEFYDKEGVLLKREVADGVLDIAEFGAWDTKFREETNSKRLDSRSSRVVNKELEGTGYAAQEYIRDVDSVIPTKLIVLAQPSDDAVREVGTVSTLPNVHFDYNYIRPVGVENILSKSYNISTTGSPKEKLIVGYKVSNELYNTYNLRYTSTNKNSSPTFINGGDAVILDFDTSNGKGAYRLGEFNSDLVISLKDEKLQEYTKDNLPDLVITPVVYALTESGYVLVAEGETRTYEVGGVVYDVGSKQVTPTGIYKAYTAIDVTTDRELDEHGQLTDESISESSIFYEVNVLDGTETKLVARTLSSVGARDLSKEEYLTNDVYKDKVVYLHSGAPRMADGTKGGFDAVGSSSSYFNRVSNVFSKIKDVSFVTVDSPTSSRLVSVNDKYIDYSLIYNSKSSAISTIINRNYSSTDNYFSEISYKNIGDTEYTVTTLEGLYSLDISNLEDIRFKLSDSSLLFNQEYDNLGVIITWETDIENVEDISTELSREYLNYKVSDYHLDLPSSATSTLRSVVINHTTNIIAETVDTVGYQRTQRGGRATDTEYLVRISDIKEEKGLEVTTKTDNRSVLEGQSSILTGGIINKTREPQFTAGYVVPKELANLITGYSVISSSQKYLSDVTSVDLTDDWSYISFGDYTKGSGVELGKISKLDVVSLFGKDFAQFDIDAGTLSVPIYQVKYSDKDSLVTETETTVTTYTTKKRC